MPHVSRRDDIQDINVVSNGTERFPLVLKYHPFQQSRQKDLADELQHSDERQNGQGDFPSDLFNILLTRPEYSRYSCAHFDAISVRVPVVVRALKYQPPLLSKDHDTTSPLGSISPVNPAMLSTVFHAIAAKPYTLGKRRMPGERTGEHLRAVKRNPPRFPVAEHFKKPGHGLDDVLAPLGRMA